MALTSDPSNPGRPLLAAAGVLAVLVAAATAWLYVRRRPGEAPGVDGEHPDAAWRAQTMSGSAQ